VFKVKAFIPVFQAFLFDWPDVTLVVFGVM
jgi:hypothetical protein